jgi:phenylpropionate dioxygenase-like ring-hydroxylating dioxygenase large terminal subunit
MSATTVRCPGRATITTTIGSQSIVMVHHTDDSVRVLYNRCAHKDTQIVTDTSGNTGNVFTALSRWCLRTDGTLLSVPLRKNPDGAGLAESEAGSGIRAVRWFAPIAASCQAGAGGAGLRGLLRRSLSSFDNMVDRSPSRTARGSGRRAAMHRCNWKMLVENQTDTCHPMIVHESSAGKSVEVWKNTAEGTANRWRSRSCALREFLPFFNPWASGSGTTATAIQASPIRSIPTIRRCRLLRADDGGLWRRSRQVDLDENRQHDLFPQPDDWVDPAAAPSSSPSPPTGRWSSPGPSGWSMRRPAVGAHADVQPPDNAPTSVVGHDDLEMYERAQRGLHANGNEWVNLQRLYERGEERAAQQRHRRHLGSQMRNQFRAWTKFMTMSL